MTYLAEFLGKNFFDNEDAVNMAVRRQGLSLNLKVKGDTIEGTNRPFKDFADIDVDPKRLTITIDRNGKILSTKRG